MGIDQSPYENGESPFPYGDANETIPGFHMGILNMEMGIDQSPYGNGESPFSYGDANEMIPVSIWGSPCRNGYPFPYEDGSVTNPFP